MISTFWSKLAFSGSLLSSVFVLTAGTSFAHIESDIEDLSFETLENYATYKSFRDALSAAEREAFRNNDPFDPTNRTPHSQNPIRRPGFNDIGSRVPIPRQGAAFIVALEVLYQTLNYYGVEHIVERRGNTIDFQVVHSSKGHFNSLDRLQVTYALQEFSRFFTAYMCNAPTIENFYHAFSQIPIEEIGLRFKFDMAWALLGNLLPTEPRAIFAVGSRWAALGQLLGGSSTITGQVEDQRELSRWLGMLTDITNLVEGLSRMVCYVDIRPDPVEEIQKRIVINRLLDLELSMFQNYESLQELVDAAIAEGRAAQVQRLQDR
ncbi:MAG: hypothetical protein EA369_02510 [Bradymonadales bacterium]|nr:MAG: hypothetical protein EA369_02510 [Bradymonadales bacterium]